MYRIFKRVFRAMVKKTWKKRDSIDGIKEAAAD